MKIRVLAKLALYLELIDEDILKLESLELDIKYSKCGVIKLDYIYRRWL